MGLFATIFQQEGRYIGRCGVYPHRDEENLVIPGEGTLGYYLARPYLEASLATEAGRAFIQYAFGELGLTRLVAGTDAENLASNRVLVKLGFVCVQSGKGGGRSYHGYELRTQSQQTA
jgi:ribosomal-protein-alanine N-acetyltransferase